MVLAVKVQQCGLPYVKLLKQRVASNLMAGVGSCVYMAKIMSAAYLLKFFVVGSYYCQK